MKFSFPGLFLIASLLLLAPRLEAANSQLNDIDPKTTKVRIEGIEETRRLIVETKTAEGIDRQAFVLETLPKGFPVFHWTSEENQKRWLAQGGKIDAGEIDFLSTPSGEKQVHGPGWYVSENPLDSKSFGVKAVMAEMPADISILRGSVEPESPEAAARTFRKLRELGIFGTHVTDTWYTIFDPWPASNLKELNIERALTALSRPGARPLDKSTLKQLVEAFGLTPHPIFDKNFPALAKLMRKESLGEKDLKQLQKDFFPYFNESPLQKQLWDYLTPENRLAVMKARINPKENFLSDLITVETQFGGLPPNAQLGTVYPETAKLLDGTALSEPERAKLFSELQNILYSEPNGSSQISRRLREEFAPELRRHFAGQVAQAVSSGYSRENLVSNARGWGVPLSSLSEGAKDMGRYPDALKGDLKEIQNSLHDFGKKFLDAYQYIGEADLTVAAVQGNSQPWARYDEAGKTPLAERWKKAMELGDDASALDRASALAGAEVKYRDHPITAGGDIFLPGEKDGYFRATADEVNALKANPFLKVRTKADPWPQSEAYATSLVRYDYASPGHFEQFAQYLPEDLLTELRAAAKAGDLLDPKSETYRDLCQRMVTHLSENLEKDADTALQKYVRRISVHPYDDMNGRYSRLMYAKEQGAPLTMRHWNLDILTSPEELAALRDEGARQHLARASDLKAMEAKDPNFPRYFEAPEIYEGFFHSPVTLGDKQSHRQAMQDFFKNPEHLDMIRKKEIAMLEWRAWDMEVDRLLSLPANERDAALAAWARANLRPEPRTRARFEALLKASREAAEKGSPARELMARWWLDLSTGDNPAYAASLADHVRSLKAPLREAFLEARLAQRIPPSVSFGPDFEKALLAKAEAKLKGPAGIGRQDSAVFLAERDAGDPQSLQKALLHFSKDPEAASITKQVLNSPAAGTRSAAITALVDLPRNSLNKEMREELMRSLANLPETTQTELALKLVNHPDHWLATETWKAIARYSGEGEGEEGGGAALSRVLKDERMKAKLLERMKKDPGNSAYWQQLSYFLGDDSNLEQIKLYKAMKDAKAWKTFAGMLDSQRDQLEYLLNGEVEPDSSAHKLGKYLRAEVPKLIKEAPEHTSQAKLALWALAQDPEEKARLSREALEGFHLTGPNDRRKVMNRFLEIARNAAQGEVPEGTIRLTEVMKKAVAAGPATTKLFFEKLKQKDYAILEQAGAAVKDLAKLLNGMPEAERLELLRVILPPKGPIAPLLIAEAFEKDLPALRSSFAKALNDPRFSHYRWPLLANGVAKDPALAKEFIREALASRGIIRVSDAEAGELIKAVKAFETAPSADFFYGPKAIKASLEQRMALLAEVDTAAPRITRLAAGEAFQTALRRELKKPSGNQLEALAFVEKTSEDAWDAIAKTLGSLNDSTKPSLAEAIRVMNQSVPAEKKLAQTGIPELLKAAPNLKGLEVVPLLDLLGKSHDLNPAVIKLLGEKLMANDPGISDAAARALAKMSLREKGGKDLLMPILKQYIEQKGGAREKLAAVIRTAGLSYEKDVLPLEKARELSRGLAGGAPKPCAEWFHAWGI